ncbi:MAG: HD domain-containing protein [Pyrinomonadaceae bacterium]|nr:HD domain-containing protein [Pyrinomonadaceae bacterium]
MSATSTNIDTIAIEAFLRLAAVSDLFERYENPHSVRIAAIADEIAKLLHVGGEDRRSLRVAALLHDMGETAMERDYISRPDALTEEERIDLSRHPVIGEQEASRAGASRAAQLLIRWHHEWWNGCGYPDALRGEEIPLAARILRLADSYSALTDGRPFRPALTTSEARQHIIEWAGIEFDPMIVSLFLSLDHLQELDSFAETTQVARTEALT